MKRRLVGCLFLILALIISLLPYKTVDAATASTDFVMDGNTLVKYKGNQSVVTIPNDTEIIGDSAFEDNITITKIIMPDSVKRVKSYAFWGCEKLEEVVFSTSLTAIDDYAFMNCTGLKELTIPSNIETINIRSFADCSNLQKITIPYQVHFIHDSAFDGCYKLKIDAKEGTYASDYAKLFYQRQKENAEYEDVYNYGDAVTNSNPVSTYAPTPTPIPTIEPIVNQGNVYGQTNIVGNNAVVFMNSGNMQVFGNENVAPSAPPVSEDPVQKIDLSQYVKYDSKGKVRGALPKLTIYNGIIADQAFYKSSEIGNESLKKGIRELGEFAYARSSIKSLYIPEGATTIGYGAFYACKSLETVMLPSSITKIAPKAFDQTPYIDNFFKSGNAFLINNSTLLKYNGTSSDVIIPEGIVCIASDVFKGHNEITSVTFPSTLLYICESAFEECSGLSSVILPNSLNRIDDRAFYNTSIKAVNLPGEVKFLGYNAFNSNVSVIGLYEPQLSIEGSTSRLSNSQYRNTVINNDVFGFLSDSTTVGEPTVFVFGESGYAILSGSDKNYYLSLKQENSINSINKAYTSVFNSDIKDGRYYQVIFSDYTKVPINRLGTHTLKVLVPIDGFEDEYTQAYGLDSNGQLTSLKSEKISYNNNKYIKIETNYISDFVITSTGIEDNGLLTDYVSLESLSQRNYHEPEQIVDNKVNFFALIKSVISVALTITGLYFLIFKRRSVKIR